MISSLIRLSGETLFTVCPDGFLKVSACENLVKTRTLFSLSGVSVFNRLQHDPHFLFCRSRARPRLNPSLSCISLGNPPSVRVHKVVFMLHLLIIAIISIQMAIINTNIESRAPPPARCLPGAAVIVRTVQSSNLMRGVCPQASGSGRWKTVAILSLFPTSSFPRATSW